MTLMSTSVDGASVVAMRSVFSGYDGRPILRGVDLEVEAGEVVAILGANGSGKSTLVRTLLGLTPVLAGSLRLFGAPAGRFRDRARIGYVPQRDTVGGGVPATVEEVVAAGRLGRRRLLGPVLRAPDHAVVAHAIATVGLEEKAGRPVNTLSGGQQRRALIARALAGEPDLLVMDEPLAGVDQPNVEILVRTLRELVERGMTLLLVTHELASVASLVDRAVVLRHGRADYDGPPDLVAGFAGHDPPGHAAPSGADADLRIGSGVIE